VSRTHRPSAPYLWGLRSEGPFLASAAAAVATVGTLSLALRGAEIPLFLAHLVVLILAAGSAYLLDDSAVHVTAVVPRSLLRRRLRLLLQGWPVTALSWGAVMTLLGWRSPSVPLAALTWEVAGVSCLSVAAAAVVSRHGEPEPGNLVASILGLGFVGVLICQPMFRVTLLIADGSDPARAGWWTAVIALSVTAFLAASRDGATRSNVAASGHRGQG
jgi:hypothetical protein